jgi:hypothetical protein
VGVGALIWRGGHIPNDPNGPLFATRRVLSIHRRESAQEQAADVSQHGRTARRHSVFGQKRIEFGERAVDNLGGSGVAEVEGEVDSEIGGVKLLLDGAMARAEGGSCAGARGAALAACGGAMLAAAGVSGDFRGIRG